MVSDFVESLFLQKISSAYPLGEPALPVERVMGIEPTRPAWKAGILPLNYTRKRSFYKDFLLPSLNAYI